MVTKGALKLKSRRLLIRLLPWICLGLFAWIVYAGTSWPPVKWLDRHVQDLSRWPSPSSNLSTSDQLSDFQRANTQAEAQKLLSGRWTVARIRGHIASTRHLLLLEQGQQDGVKRGQPVVVNGYLAGVIWQVEGSQSTAILFGDPDFSVAAMVPDSKTDGLVETRNGGLVLDHVLDSSSIAGRQIMTSGEGGLLPAGLPIGQISDKITTSPNNESSWGVEYPGVNGKLWAAIYQGANQ